MPFVEARAVYTIDDLRRWPEATAGLEFPLRLGVMGDPVAHSASPPMHDAALSTAGLPLRYARLHIRPAELAEALGLLAGTGFVGVNLTIPHKAAALPLLDAVDPSAVRLGVVNTVRVEADGRLRGFNTDGPGFVRAVRGEFGFELAGKRIMILGAAGGAGRALAAQCLLEGCGPLVLANRTFDKGQALARELRAKFPGHTAPVEAVAWEGLAAPPLPAGLDLVVNTSPVGLQPGDISPLPAAGLPPGLFVFDTVYRKDGTPTPLVAAAREAGRRAVGGYALLLHQGALAFEHWFDRPAPVEVMRGAL